MEDLQTAGKTFAVPEAAKSLSAGAKAAKRRLEYVKSRCCNNLHACARLMNDAEVQIGMRLAVLGSAPFAKEWRKSCVDYKGPSGNRAWMLSRSRGAVLNSLKELYRTFYDYRALEHAGMTVTVSQD